MICKRCEGKIHSGKIVKVNDYDAPLMTTTYYCRHCYQAIKALDKINNLWDKVTNG